MLKSIIDRPNNGKIKNFDRMVLELGKYMNPLEMDQCIDFMNTIVDSKYDVNPSVEDCATQLKIMFGSERYIELKHQWSTHNQHLVKPIGTVKYFHKPTGTYWDGLDATDDPSDYEEIYL